MKKMTGISKFNLFLALLVFCMIAGPACAAELSGNNNIGIDVGNDDGTYLVPGTAYQLNLEAGTADLHISSDPANSAGDITQVNTTSGTFYITCTNDSRVFDDTVLMLAVNGTIADNFSVAITSSGYRWAGPAENSTLPEYGNLTYVSSALSETFAKADLSYGPQIWKPANSANSSIYTNQNMSDTEDTFSLVFIDLKAGALCNATNLTSIDDLTDRGAMKIEYVFENLQSFAVFNAYGLTNTTSAEIVTTNDVSGSLYSVLIEPEAAEPVLDNITVSPSTASVEINATANFTATAYDTGGSEMSGITFNWSVSDEAVGNVTSGGMFTGLSAGTVNVTASFGNESGYAVVTVSEAVVPTPTPTPTPATETYGGVMPAVNDVYLRVANDEGAYFNDWGNHTCRIKWVSGGFNSLHISNDSRGSDGYFVNYGQITETNDLSGTFYVSTTGGRGYQDDILMLVAVNGTVPDDFRLHITVNGYQWTPNSTPHLPPALQDITYVPLAVDEWFTKDDLIYGPQTWRPAGAIEYKIFPGQDVTDTSNKFYMMLIDLNAGVLTEETLEVNYEIENMNSLLAFNVYGYAKNVLHGTTVYYNTTEWSNCVDTSGWYVSGAPLPDAATVVIAPLSAEIPVNGKQQFTATAYDAEGSEINGAPITWSSSVTGVGTIDSDGLFTPVSEGSTIITATAESGVSQTASVTVIAAVEKVLTTITLDPDGVIMYTDQIENKTFTATGYDQFGDELSAIYTWSSTVPVVGSIDQTGFFSGKTEGTTVISVTNGSVSETATVVIKQHPDWDVTLIGATNRTLNRTGITDLSSGGLMSYTDNKGYVWEGVNLSVILALVDDNDPSTFNTTLASLDYNITIKGKASGNDKTVLITSREFIDDEKTLIAAYIMDGYEIPETSVSGRTYWPLKLTGSAIANYGRNIEEITNITIDFPPDVRRIGITSDSLIAFVGGLTNQFIGTAYGPDDQVIEYIPITWSVSDSSIGTIDSNGLFTPVKAGSVNVIATYHDISQSVAVSVLDSTDPVTWHVDRNGGRDFTTIQGAVDYAREGDTVIVHDGLYEEKVTIDKGLTLVSGNGCNSTEIYYPDPEQFVVTSTADNVLISGFNITGYHSASNSYLGGIQISGDNCVISDNLFPTVRSIHVVSPENLIIENNLFIDNGNLEVDGVNHNLTIRNNVFYTFASKPMDIRGEGSDLVIFNNSITSTHSSSDGIALFGTFDNVTISENEIFCSMGIYVSVNENSDINSAKILNNNIQASSKAAVYLYKDGEDIEIAGNRLSSGEYFVLLIHTPTGEVSVHHNELSSGYTQMTYMRYCEDYLNFYANNISIGSSNTGGLLRYSLATLNSTKQYTYEYNGETFSGFIGNEYNTYSGIDTSGDFLGNTPFVEDGVYDYHPLTGTYS
ncbi:MAG: Ig-like domain-containing protein, partial [Dehalococcoidales bacterium]|nr:Ig-like domain-containing protein [Dehalococcoidales bacterium]